jgi:predicted MFS family arabinose efflux permease
MHKNIKLLLTCSILIHGGVNLLAPIYALYIKELGGTLLLASTTIGFYAILKGILYFLFKKLDETRFNSKFMIAGGYFMFAVSYVLYIFASKSIHVFGIQALLAFAEVVINPSWSSTIAISLTKGKERGIYSDFYGYRSVFEGLAAIGGGFLAMHLGFNALFGLMAGFALMASMLGLFLEKSNI